MNQKNYPQRRSLYAVLTSEEYQNLGHIVKKLQFPSTSSYLTAVCHTTLYGWHTCCHIPDADLDPVTSTWIRWQKARMQEEDRLRQTYFDLLSDLAFPVIAARGAQLAFHLLENEIETALAERTGCIPPADQLKNWTRIYETIYAEELGKHRAGLLRETTEETDD